MAAGDGFQLPFGVKPVNPTPVDTWSGPYYGTTVVGACAVALSSIDVVRRFPTMEVRLIAGNVGYKYWFRNGTTDADLVEFVGGAGSAGATGASGLPGNQGATGASGLQGLPGATGASGLQGLPGATGASGLPGQQGATGATGFGATGATGPTGPPGTSVTIEGTLALTSGNEQTELNDSGNSWYPPQQGYGVIDANTGNLWVYDGTLWNNVGEVRGPQGATGASGLPGPTGATGATADIIPTVTNYLSTNNVQISALNVFANLYTDQLSVSSRTVLSDHLYYSTDKQVTQLSALSGNYDEGQFIGRVKLSQNNTRLINVGENWTAKDSSRKWYFIAMSSDGKYQSAVVNDIGQIYISNDYGNTWTPKESNRNWFGIAMSSDGKYQSATVAGGQIYISNDYGNTWTAKESNRNWRGIAMSSDGKYQTAVVLTGQIYISSDYGNTWIPKESNRFWYGIAMSSDGKYQSATVEGGQIYISSDYGNTWTPKESRSDWYGIIAMSSDGKYQSATVNGGQIYVSNDYGNTWTPKESIRNWRIIAMSSDGKYQSAVAFGGQIYTSVADELIDGSLTVTNISAIGTLFGRAQDSQLSLTSTNTVQNSAITSKLNTLEQNLSSLADPPVYDLPQPLLDSFTGTPFEIGQTVTQTLNVNWNQNDGGSLINGTVTRNGITVLTYNSLPQTLSVNEQTGGTNTTYRNTVNYNQGPILNNSLGYPDPTGRVSAGSQFIERSHRGFYKIFFGSVDVIPAIRSLPKSKFDQAGSSGSITPAEFGTISEVNIIFALPSPRILTSVVTDANETITNDFTLSSTHVQLPNGVWYPYNYYKLTTVIPLNIPFKTITYANP